MRHASGSSLVAVGITVLALGAVVGFHSMPTLARAESNMREAGRLLGRAGSIETVRREHEIAALKLAQLESHAKSFLRAIPTQPDQAQLMRMLALGTGEDVGKQTIVAGEPLPATNLASNKLQAVPVTVEMKSSFARVMELLARAEGGTRLVRPIQIEIKRVADDKLVAGSSTVPFVDARIELDAVFGSATSVQGDAR